MKSTAIERSRSFEPKLGSAAPVELHSQLKRAALHGGARVRDLRDADRRKDEFLAMLGHEMRNPLAPIRNAMQILRLKSGADPELQQVAEMVERQVQQLARLVDDLLDVSRVGHGKINLNMRPVDLRAVVAMAVEMSGPLIDARRHVLTLSLPAYAVDVEGDAGRLAQVVTNLLNNSAKYSEDGGRIELSVQAVGDWAPARARRGRRDRAGDAAKNFRSVYPGIKLAEPRRRGAGHWTGPGAQRDRAAWRLCASFECGPRAGDRAGRSSATSEEEDARG